MKSIVFYLFNFNRGGAEWVITNLANSMSQNNVDITLLTVKKGDMLNELHKDIKSMHFNGSYLKSFYFLGRTLRKNNFDVVFTTQRTASVFCYLVTKLSFTKTRHIVREAASNFQSSFVGKKYLMKRIWKFLYRMSYNHAYRIIVNSDGTRKGLEVAGIIKPQKNNVYQIDNPLDIELVKRRSKLEDVDGITFNKKTIVTIGRLVPQKNINGLLNAYKKTLDTIPISQLIIIGEGPEESKLKQLAVDLDLSKKIIFTGKISNPYPILKNADLFVLASKWEGFGQVIVEALALGVPVVSTNIAEGPAHILNNGQFGELVTINSVDDLAAGIVKSLNVTHDREKLKLRAELFDKDKISSKYKDVIFG